MARETLHTEASGSGYRSPRELEAQCGDHVHKAGCGDGFFCSVKGALLEEFHRPSSAGSKAPADWCAHLHMWVTRTGECSSLFPVCAITEFSCDRNGDSALPWTFSWPAHGDK